MTFDEYQVAASRTMQYPSVGFNMVYPALGLVGEAGEVAEKIKKIWRNKGRIYLDGSDEILSLRDELGDVLWYISALATEIGFPLENIAKRNIEKLEDRANRNVINSEGDNR